MDIIRIKLEDSFYKTLRHTSIARDILNIYPSEPIEETAKIMAQLLHKSPVGNFARRLCENDKAFPNYAAICSEAFENTMLRLLEEETESIV